MYLLLNQWPGFVFLYHMPLNPWYWKVNRGPSMCALITSLILRGLRNTVKVPYPGIEPQNWLASLLDPWAVIWCEALFWPTDTTVVSVALLFSAFSLRLDRLVFMCSWCSWSVMLFCFFLAFGKIGVHDTVSQWCYSLFFLHLGRFVFMMQSISDAIPCFFPAFG